jgi:hypothetical protein
LPFNVASILDLSIESLPRKCTDFRLPAILDIKHDTRTVQHGSFLKTLVVVARLVMTVTGICGGSPRCLEDGCSQIGQGKQPDVSRLQESRANIIVGGSESVKMSSSIGDTSGNFKVSSPSSVSGRGAVFVNSLATVQAY